MSCKKVYWLFLSRKYWSRIMLTLKMKSDASNASFCSGKAHRVQPHQRRWRAFAQLYRLCDCKQLGELSSSFRVCLFRLANLQPLTRSVRCSMRVVVGAIPNFVCISLLLFFLGGDEQVCHGCNTLQRSCGGVSLSCKGELGSGRSPPHPRRFSNSRRCCHVVKVLAKSKGLDWKTIRRLSEVQQGLNASLEDM